MNSTPLEAKDLRLLLATSISLWAVAPTEWLVAKPAKIARASREARWNLA